MLGIDSNYNTTNLQNLFDDLQRLLNGRADGYVTDASINKISEQRAKIAKNPAFPIRPFHFILSFEFGKVLMKGRGEERKSPATEE